MTETKEEYEGSNNQCRILIQCALFQHPMTANSLDVTVNGDHVATYTREELLSNRVNVVFRSREDACTLVLVIQHTDGEPDHLVANLIRPSVKRVCCVRLQQRAIVRVRPPTRAAAGRARVAIRALADGRRGE